MDLSKISVGSMNHASSKSFIYTIKSLHCRAPWGLVFGSLGAVLCLSWACLLPVLTSLEVLRGPLEFMGAVLRFSWAVLGLSSSCLEFVLGFVLVLAFLGVVRGFKGLPGTRLGLPVTSLGHEPKNNLWR